jgi:hypothetical protein
VDSISLILLDGSLAVLPDDEHPKVKTITVPGRKDGAPPSYWEGVVAVCAKVFPGKPSRFQARSARGVADGLQDAVIELKEGQVNLAAVFTKKKASTYFLTMDRTEAGDGAPAKPVAYAWTPGMHFSLKMEGLHPGLHLLTLFKGSADHPERTAEQAWILLTDPKDHKDTAQAFSQMVQMTEKWGEDRDEEARTLQRVWLEVLSSRPGR